MSKPIYLTKQIAAERLRLSPRRVLELASAGKIRHTRNIDPETNREQTVLLASDVNKIAAGATSTALAAPAAADARLSRTPAAFPTEIPDRPWMTAEEAEEYSGLPAHFLLRMIADGRLAALDVGVRPGGRYRISRTDLDAIRGETLSVRSSK